MLFTIVDLILIVAVIVFVLIGFFMGLIQAVGAIIGVVLGAWLAGQNYLTLADWLKPYLFNNVTITKIVAFMLIFAIVNRLVALIFWIVNKIFKIASFIPFLGSINRLAGAILGLVEGVLIVGLSIYVIAKFSADITWLVNPINSSKVAHFLVYLTGFLASLLPDTISTISSIF